MKEDTDQLGLNDPIESGGIKHLENAGLNVKQTHTKVSAGNLGVCSTIDLYNKILKVKTNSNINNSPGKENLEF